VDAAEFPPLSAGGRIAAIALALAATGGMGVAARCLSATAARCSFQTLTGAAPRLDVPYAATRAPAVAAMLSLAAVGPGDRVVDLGTGDGRIAIAAARRGATATGIDIDPVLIAEAQANARAAGVADRVRFRVEDLFATPLAEADVVTLFLLPEINARLRPRILSTMAPGARVVSHAFDMGDWSPDAVARVGGDRLYLWRVPARVAGDWRTAIDGRDVLLRVHQRFQAVGGTLDGVPISDGRLDGRALRFRAGARTYAGRVEGDAIVGRDWRAARAPVTAGARPVPPPTGRPSPHSPPAP
jgi:SAM-dependent methyltransferase